MRRWPCRRPAWTATCMRWPRRSVSASRASCRPSPDTMHRTARLPKKSTRPTSLRRGLATGRPCSIRSTQRCRRSPKTGPSASRSFEAGLNEDLRRNGAVHRLPQPTPPDPSHRRLHRTRRRCCPRLTPWLPTGRRRCGPVSVPRSPRSRHRPWSRISGSTSTRRCNLNSSRCPTRSRSTKPRGSLPNCRRSSSPMPSRSGGA